MYHGQWTFSIVFLYMFSSIALLYLFIVDLGDYFNAILLSQWQR